MRSAAGYLQGALQKRRLAADQHFARCRLAVRIISIGT